MKPDSDSDRPTTPSQANGDAIPLLTERLYVATLPPVMDEDEVAGVPEPAAAPAPVSMPEPVAEAAAAASEAQPAADEPGATEQATEETAVPRVTPVSDIGIVRDALLDDLERSLPGQIESMIRREVSNAIDDAVFRVVAETQDALAHAIGQVVERAVREELNRLRNESG